MRLIFFMLVMVIVFGAGCEKDALRLHLPQKEVEPRNLVTKHFLESCKEENTGLYRVDLRFKSQGNVYFPIGVIATAADECYTISQPIEFDVNYGVNDFVTGLTRFRYIRYKFRAKSCDEAEQIGECIEGYLLENMIEL